MNNQSRETEPFLLLAGILSSLAALLHIGVIIGGPAWYRFFGAGEEMVSMAESGSLYPAIITFFIALILSAWALYAFSGAGVMQRLPFLRPALVIITGIYLVRGLGVVPLFILSPEMVDTFMIWSSAIVTLYGLSYAIGTWRCWNELGERRTRLDRREEER
jgi:hypothetical protein